MTFTKEQLQEIIDTDHVQCGEASALARMALAGMEAVPVAWRRFQKTAKDGGYWVHYDERNTDSEIQPLYSAPQPAPVAQPVQVPEVAKLKQIYSLFCTPTTGSDNAMTAIHKACRAAMLQAEPVSNSDELPLDYLQGHKDGLEWAAQLAEANHPQTGDWLYDDPIDLARAIRKGPDMPTVQGGNSPVTPDGWISCSDRMPEDTKMLLAFSQGEIVAAYWNWVANPIDYKKYRAFTYLSGYILDDVTHWMPLPEPPL
ncbi:DUF551 domain-containing protein [Escherichia coli]|nr:DUF551 domain-containing protein [Escherichia coli]ELL8702318.1 DUF551 domain-containing protein [Escherichia coli]ELU4293817.1 DUF551 domain-containing protein [Escherichia coli]EMD7216374.1 DUF551 domain-containing protein [Escherichia coli]